MTLLSIFEAISDYCIYFVTMCSCLASWKGELLTHKAEKGTQKAAKGFQVPNFSVLNARKSSEKEEWRTR